MPLNSESGATTKLVTAAAWSKVRMYSSKPSVEPASSIILPTCMLPIPKRNGDDNVTS